MRVSGRTYDMAVAEQRPAEDVEAQQQQQREGAEKQAETATDTHTTTDTDKEKATLNPLRFVQRFLSHLKNEFLTAWKDADASKLVRFMICVAAVLAAPAVLCVSVLLLVVGLFWSLLGLVIGTDRLDRVAKSVGTFAEKACCGLPRLLKKAAILVAVLVVVGVILYVLFVLWQTGVL